MAGCGGGCAKESGWTPVRYYIMYVVSGYVGMGRWESIRKVEFLKNVTDEKKAKEKTRKWLEKMKKKENCYFKLKNARLVASTHKDILELT